ncbi:MAG: Dihydropteroate synthase [Chlamydiales bacterium]|nr:Dihydropteroate synthase [Chlamydiales bacterium]MCH9619133.1 Dihydropteroate synthase [Chlamydiales bacterium]MCH9622395.1 Dihydropteroate synthase [Chlamydiales bacterium]
MQSELNSREKNDVHCLPSFEKVKSNFNHDKPCKKILVGILNSTPDSYYDGGRYNSVEKAIEKGHLLFQEGADLIDVGGESTRPFATPLSEKEEMERVIPIISALNYPLSIDSYKPAVVEAAIEAGACMINDVRGCENPRMRAIVKSSALPVCVMHSQGISQTMQKNPHYPNGVVEEISQWFLKRVDTMVSEGIDPKQIIFDPGIGFGKTVEHNLEILRGLKTFKKLGFPLYIGLSRKSFMQKILGLGVNDVLPTTLALGTISLLNGADYLRVHDVKEHREILTVMERL